MKAYRKSISFPGEMAKWVEEEAIRTRRTISSIVQEGVELMMKKAKDQTDLKNAERITK